MGDNIELAASNNPNNPNSDDEALFASYRENRSVETRNLIVNKYLYLADIISKRFLN